MRKSKNRYFYHPGAITLNVVWMEREFDAYKLFRCMCPSNYNRFWDRAGYLWKNRHIIIPPMHSTPPLGGFPSEYWHHVWYGKTRVGSLPDGEKILKISLFVLVQLWNVTDGQTNGRTPGNGNSRTMHSIALQKMMVFDGGDVKILCSNPQKALYWVIPRFLSYSTWTSVNRCDL